MTSISADKATFRPFPLFYDDLAHIQPTFMPAPTKMSLPYTITILTKPLPRGLYSAGLTYIIDFFLVMLIIKLFVSKRILECDWLVAWY